eukprot:CAMPEP_0198127646 /NCGR_PEP_ID=MMETSP1442-20131203/47648_1 /TAXON_ID= /ORGANISM="Craspedostauros australis, Strain CCMP3328" /LENGTH=123 /DNA_ID=CAMNT_0043787661 /DNA_START=1093 /DNA_END=1464 /DNA_ORIENTATION=+
MKNGLAAVAEFDEVLRIVFQAYGAADRSGATVIAILCGVRLREVAVPSHDVVLRAVVIVVAFDAQHLRAREQAARHRVFVLEDPAVLSQVVGLEAPSADGSDHEQHGFEDEEDEHDGEDGTRK